MASERAKQMQQANTLAEVLASLDRIEIALGIKPKPDDTSNVKPKVEAKKLDTALSGEWPGKPATATETAARQGTASRQNPVGGKR